MEKQLYMREGRKGAKGYKRMSRGVVSVGR